MSLAKMPDTIPAPATRAVPTRRTLFGGAAAVVIGSGITAGAAASVADLVSAEPDAKLIRLCAEFVRLELASRAIFDGPAAIEDEDAAYAASAPLEAKMDDLLDEMESIQAVSAAGVLARTRGQ